MLKYGSVIASSATLGLVVGLGAPVGFFSGALWIFFGVLALYLARVDPLARSGISPFWIVSGQVVVYGLVVPTFIAMEVILERVDYTPWLSAATALTALAGLAYGAGTLAHLRRRPRSKRIYSVAPLVRLRPSPRAGWIVLAVAWLVMLYRVAAYGLGGSAVRFGTDRALAEGATAYITYAPQYLAGVGLYLAYLSSSSLQRWICIATLVLVDAYFFAFGIRYLFIVTTVAIALLIGWQHYKSILIPSRWLVIAAIFTFVVVGIVGGLRQRDARGRGMPFLQAATGSLEIVTPLAGVVRYTEMNGYLMGSSYTYLFQQVVPRSIWQDKPLPPIVTVIASYTKGSEGRAFPLWGEMYLNFGVFGVAVGMFIFGYGVSGLTRWWLINRGSRPGYDVVAAFAIPLLLQWISRGYFVQGVYNTFGFTIGPLVFLLLDRRRSAGALRTSAESAPAAAVSR